VLLCRCGEHQRVSLCEHCMVIAEASPVCSTEGTMSSVALQTIPFGKWWRQKFHMEATMLTSESCNWCIHGSRFIVFSLKLITCTFSL